MTPYCAVDATPGYNTDVTQSQLRRPRVFISSTVFDFRDLRSALRYWLEQAGYDVQLSEFNNFVRRPNDDVFTTCFNNVRDADHYVLLIGGRRGSWYDEARKLTVTRQEFRVASENSVSGTTGITALVRSEVETALTQWGEDGRPAGEFSIIDDPPFIEDFLAEVQSPAVDGEESRWVYAFTDFRDIIDALRVVLRLQTSIQRRLTRRNLLDEILHNMTLFMTKSSGICSPTYEFATSERDAVTIQEDQLLGNTWVTSAHLGRLGTLVFSKPRRRLRCRLIENALDSGLFLAVDPQSGDIETTVEHASLLALYNDILGFEEYRGYAGMNEIEQHFIALGRSANQGYIGEGTDVDSQKLAILLGLHDRMDDVFKGLAQFARWLYGTIDSPAITRRPISPVEGMSERTEAQLVSIEELRWALQNQVFPFGTNLPKELREAMENGKASQIEELRKVIPETYMSDQQLAEAIRDTLDKLAVDEFPGPVDVTRRAPHDDA